MNTLTKPDDLFIGIMSGTSLDGVDVAIVRFGESIECVASDTTPFPEGFRSVLYQLASERKTEIDTLVRSHFVLAEIYAEAVRATLKKAGLASNNIRAIGSHGQTIRHLPSPEKLTSDTSAVCATFQLGSGAALAVLSGIDVVSDFRSADIAVGGQGAPLVPMFDAVFLRDDIRDRATLNIGGIANVTILPARNSKKEIIAYDTGPGNMLVDELTRRYFGVPYDKDGAIASRGVINQELLTEMMLHEYFSAPAPKSTGRELFGGRFLDLLTSKVEMDRIDATDAVATASELTAQSVAFELMDWNADVIVSGGGADNTFIIRRLQELLPNSVVKRSDDFGIPADAKEAIAFAYFAKAYLDETLIHLHRTTGASRQLILGSLSRGK